MLDGKVGPEFDEIAMLAGRGLIFSPDGNRVAYKAYRGNILSDDMRKEILVVDGKPGPDYDRIGDPVFSLDGKRFAYTAQKRGDYMVVVDGQPGQAFGYSESPSKPMFSPDGRHIAYRTRTLVVVDGQPGPKYDQIIENGPTFSTGGLLEYLAAREGTLFRVGQNVAP